MSHLNKPCEIHKKLLTLSFLLTILSCHRIETKGDKVINTTKETIAESRQKFSIQKDQLIDKFFPSYDSYQPDTKNNRKRFTKHLQVDLTEDIKNIYAHGDFLGADYKVLIAFTCDQPTVDKIVAIKKMQLTKSKDDDGLFFLDELEWWDKKKIELLQPYKVGKKAEYWQYLWFDQKTGQAFYEEFSL